MHWNVVTSKRFVLSHFDWNDREKKAREREEHKHRKSTRGTCVNSFFFVEIF